MKKYLKVFFNILFLIITYYFIQTLTQFTYAFVIYFRNVTNSSNLNVVAVEAIYKMANKKAIISLVAIIITIILYYLFYFKKNNVKLNERLILEKIRVKDFTNVILMGICITFLNYSLVCINNFFNIVVNRYKSGGDVYNLSTSIIGILVLVIFVPMFEEILFRGLIFYELNKVVNIKLAILIQAIIFSLSHNNNIQCIYTFILGIVLAVIYVEKRNIIYCIIVHIIFNLLGTVILPLFEIPINLAIITFVICSILVLCKIIRIHNGLYMGKIKGLFQKT